MFKLIDNDGDISLEKIEDIRHAFDEDALVVSEDVADIIQKLLDKNRRLANRLAQGSSFVGSQLKSALAQAFNEGVQAKEDTLFHEKILGESVDVPNPYEGSVL